MYLLFDTETTGLPKRYDAPLSDSDNWPRCIQLAWQLHDELGGLVDQGDFLVRPDGFNIPYESEQVHGISTDLALEEGKPLEEVIEVFMKVLSRARFLVGQNVDFDKNIVGAELYRLGIDNPMPEMASLDTCTETTAELCRIPGGRGGRFKLPQLSELYAHLFDEGFVEAHNAAADTEATARCFFELLRRGSYTLEELQATPDYLQRFKEANPSTIRLYGLEHRNFKSASDKIRARQRQEADTGLSDGQVNENRELLEAMPFVHLHNHSQFSILQSTSSTKDLVEAAAKDSMPAVALTDSGNMMGAFHFVKAVNDHNRNLPDDQKANALKAIVGCEFNVCEDHLDRSHKDNGFQIVFLAKNKEGYHNLAKMASVAYTDGFYYVPRIDRQIVKQYSENLMVLTGGRYGELASKLLNQGERQAEEGLLWWKETFGEDLYIEIMRHGQEDEERINKDLIALGRKHAIKLVACNNTFYINKEDANAHDILLCVKDGEKQATPIGRGRGYRFGLPNDEYYFKSQQEMKDLFKDLPEAITNISEVIDKVTPFTLEREVLLPNFAIPEEFLDPLDADGGKRGENAYLRHLTYEGAKRRYPELSDEIQQRLDFELEVIANTGYPGYFLIVQDFIAEARKMGVSVGPGRGSAAGSAVAYCLGITNIDPIEYDLLFERFLNPDRISMPDIDIDFDDEGRGRVMDYVIDKYGSNQVAQIITYGTMAAKSSIRDTARVLDLPLGDADRIAKLIPNMTKLGKIFDVPENDLKSRFRNEDLQKVNELLNLSEGEDLEAQTINQARVLEGSVRNTGIHACGVIITPDDITNFVPVATAKDSDLYVTQFDNSVVESAGLLKMDFLGLKTLTLIKDTVKLVKHIHGVELEPDNFPLDDQKTYELFQRGETVGIFQYESPGMQKHMKDLKPTVFADLIAMNALYRPGPMEYIPSFVRRKHGEEEITYDLPEMEEYLKETYGITVYQEQVMLLSQKLADFTKGEADVLRKAMGKKQKAVLDKMKPKFLEQAMAKGHEEEKLEKIWKDWEAFASYAFNKSHSTCYAWIAYQTAYLKAHYPAEYMAAVLSNNMNDIKQVTFFMEECRRMGLEVLGPDVNESFYKFTVNEHGAIRFGMGAIKGVGSGAVATIVENRDDGRYKSIFDLAKRVDLRAANKKAFENLVLAGGFDGFETHRAQYMHDDGDGVAYYEKVLRYAARYQESQNSAQVSLFGEASEVQIPEPEVPPCEEWPTMKKLKLEKEVVGIYISGHPLDDYKTELKAFCSVTVSDLKLLDEYSSRPDDKQIRNLLNRSVTFGGVVGDVQHLEARNGKGWARFVIEDYDESHEFRIFNEEYLKFRHMLVPNSFLHIRATVKEGFLNRETGKRGNPRINFTDMQLLQDCMEKQANKLTLRMPLEKVQEGLIDELKDLFKSHKGGKHLYFTLYDVEDKVKLTMPSRKHKVSISKELLDELEYLELNYKLN